MAAEILDGKAVAAQVRADVARDVAAFAAQYGGAGPGLATILIGEDAASAVYVAASRRPAKRWEWRASPSPGGRRPRAEVVALIERLNADDASAGSSASCRSRTSSTASS